MTSQLHSRTALLLGSDALSRIRSARVILFGVGGVGSWCAESLLRSGIEHLTIVDSDTVSPTNLNRQLPATVDTIGQSKVEVLRKRLLTINPSADITPLHMVYTEETAPQFHLEQYDYVIDAIDSLKDKAALILHATQLSRDIKRGTLAGPGVAPSLTFFSSMGAALRIDPTMIRVSEFWKVRNDSLARALRNRLKRNKQMPAVKFMCVHSDEPPMPNLGTVATDDTCSYKAQINGSLCHITGIFGFTLAGLVLNHINHHNPQPNE